MSYNAHQQNFCWYIKQWCMLRGHDFYLKRELMKAIGFPSFATRTRVLLTNRIAG